MCEAKGMKNEKQMSMLLKYKPSSSESDMNVSCIASGATTLYFSSVIDVVIATSESVTGFNES